MHKKTRIDIDQLLSFITDDEHRRVELTEALVDRVLFFTCLRSAERDRFLDFLGPTDQFLKFVMDDWHIMTAPREPAPTKEVWQSLMKEIKNNPNKYQ